MNVRMKTLRLATAFVLAGTLTTPLAAQTTNTSKPTSNSTSGIEPANQNMALTPTPVMQQVSPWVTTYLPLASTIVVAAAAVVLVWLTSRYVRLTGRMVEETQESREPSVTVDFEWPGDFLRLVVVNHGLSPAKNVRIVVLKDVPWLQLGKQKQGIANCAPVKDGVSYLTPSRKLIYLLGQPNWSNKPDEQMEASLHISYENEAGKLYEHTVDFNFGQMRGVLFESFMDTNSAVAEAIRDAERRRHADHWSS